MPVYPFQPELLHHVPPVCTHETPLLFVHGACLDPRTFADFLMPELATQGYETHALSLRYHETWRGYMTFHGSRIRDYVADLAKVVAKMPRPPLLIGHSMGGYIIMKYLEQHPPIAGSILISSIPVTGFWKGFWRTIRMFWLEHTLSTLTLRRNVFQVSAEQFQHYCFSHPLPPGRLEVYHSRLHLESFMVLWDMIVADLPRPQSAARLPMLVMGGAHDVIFDAGEILATARAYEADLHIFSQYAHDFIREEGHQDAVKIITAWLGKNGF